MRVDINTAGCSTIVWIQFPNGNFMEFPAICGIASVRIGGNSFDLKHVPKMADLWKNPDFPWLFFCTI